MLQRQPEQPMPNGTLCPSHQWPSCASPDTAPSSNPSPNREGGHEHINAQNDAELEESWEEIRLHGLQPQMVALCRGTLPGAYSHLVLLQKQRQNETWAGTPHCGRGSRGNRFWIPLTPTKSRSTVLCPLCIQHARTCAQCQYHPSQHKIDIREL